VVPTDEFYWLGQVYLATPYRAHPLGLVRSFVESCDLAGRMILKGARVYSPIAHCHSVAIHACIDAYDDDIWLPQFNLMMKKCDTLVVALMDGWTVSKGVKHEMDFFRNEMKTIYFIDPDTLRLT
jgi:hypothetical protein